MDRELPRVLVPTINVWQDKGSVRTLPEIFAAWDKDKVAQIYTRAALPATNSCEKFLRINESAVLKSVFKRGITTTREVENTFEADEKALAELSEEKKRYERAGKKHSHFLTFCREMVWLLGKWKTPELDRFTEEFDPEMLFCTIYPFIYIARIQRYLIKKLSIPVVCYLFDDNYSYKACGLNPFALIHRFWLRKNVKALVRRADKLFVISPMQQEEVKRVFGKDSTILTRAIDPKEKFVPKKPSEPIEMIYTGKLILGRDSTLAEIAKAVANINRDRERIRFSIYSVNAPKEKYRELFSSGGTEYKGGVTADKIAALQEAADITVFAEALKGKNRFGARLSFSTKLTDYFLSGRCIFAVGDKDIAPMDYLRREDAAITVNSVGDIEKELRELVENREKISIYGEKAYLCGVRNHSREKVLGNFVREMLSTYDDNRRTEK